MELDQCVGWDRGALRRALCFARSGAFFSLGIEVADAEPRQGPLQGLMIVVRSPTTVSYSGRGRLASSCESLGFEAILQVLPLAAQPAKKGAFKLPVIEPVGLGTPVLARHRYPCGSDDMGLNTSRSEPAGQPEVVPTSLQDVVARPKARVTPHDLDALRLQNVARHKRPRHYRFVESLPKNSYGKILKTNLRKLLKEADKA